MSNKNRERKEEGKKIKLKARDDLYSIYIYMWGKKEKTEDYRTIARELYFQPPGARLTRRLRRSCC